MSKSAKAMFATKDISDYMIVCIFEFARQKGLSPREAYLYLSNWGGLEFLETCYPAEHTLSIDDAVEDLTLYCMRNGGKIE